MSISHTGSWSGEALISWMHNTSGCSRSIRSCSSPWRARMPLTFQVAIFITVARLSYAALHAHRNHRPAALRCDGARLRIGRRRRPAAGTAASGPVADDGRGAQGARPGARGRLEDGSGAELRRGRRPRRSGGAGADGHRAVLHHRRGPRQGAGVGHVRPAERQPGAVRHQPRVRQPEHHRPRPPLSGPGRRAGSAQQPGARGGRLFGRLGPAGRRRGQGRGSRVLIVSVKWTVRVVLLILAVLALLSIPRPGGAQTQATPPELSLADALGLINAAHADAAAKNLRLTVAVVNQRGDVIAVGRMDGANPGTVDTAIGKAMVSAIFGLPSAALVSRAGTPIGQGVNAHTSGRLRFLQGAWPIVRGGFTVGAIAGSGASAQQDEDAVKAALAAAAPR